MKFPGDNDFMKVCKFIQYTCYALYVGQQVLFHMHECRLFLDMRGAQAC